jgi:parallel beta-helix repeat protein
MTRDNSVNSDRAMNVRGRFGPAVLIGVLIALAGTAVPALALTPISGCPASITQSGNYQLTADLACTISISASNVSLALNGHMITPGSPNDGIDVNVGGGGRLNHVGIQGPGLIAGNGAGLGILIVNTDYSQVDLVTIKNTQVGIDGQSSTFLTLGSNVIGRSAQYGILLLTCASCVVSGNDASANTHGILVPAGSSAMTVSGNTTNGNSGNGIFISSGAGTRVFGNVTNANGSSGISVGASGVQVFSNTSSMANGTDLTDGSPVCAGNLWGNNVFQTANAACIH